MNESRTCTDADTTLTQACSADVPETPESLGAMAALEAKAKQQGAVLFFRDPIHIRRDLINKRFEIGAYTPRGHTCSNLVELLDNHAAAPAGSFAMQHLPRLINYQIQRLERLQREAKGE